MHITRDADGESVEEIQEWVNLSDYYLECCGYMYDEGEDLHRGMKIPRCPDCGTNNPKGSEKGDYIWQEILMDDGCMWQLKGRTWDSNMTLEEIQDVVGGHYTYFPAGYLEDDVIQMIVNEAGLWKNLDYNHLATMQTHTVMDPVVGNVLVKIDRKLTTSSYWLEESIGEDE